MRLPPSLKLLNKFSRRPLTGPDFVELCRLNDIDVVLSRECSRGMYYFAQGRHTIAISSGLTPRDRRLVGWHEFAHFLQNFYKREPVASFSNVQPDLASEKLADVFALVATRPDHIRITGGQDFIRMIMEGAIK
jgi:hypothetical protein